MTDEELRQQHPIIPWDQPLPITVPDVGKGLACRYCVARYGFQGANVNGLAQTIEEFDEHMTLMHVKVSPGSGQAT